MWESHFSCAVTDTHMREKYKLSIPRLMHQVTKIIHLFIPLKQFNSCYLLWQILTYILDLPTLLCPEVTGDKGSRDAAKRTCSTKTDVLTAKYCNQTASKQHQDSQRYHKWLWKYHTFHSYKLPNCFGVTCHKLWLEKMLCVMIRKCSVGCTYCHKTKWIKIILYYRQI